MERSVEEAGAEEAVVGGNRIAVSHTGDEVDGRGDRIGFRDSRRLRNLDGMVGEVFDQIADHNDGSFLLKLGFGPEVDLLEHEAP